MLKTNELKANIGDITPISTIDWPGRASCVIFFNRCNFRCNYCQNYKLLKGERFLSINEIKKQIMDSEIFISSVIFSGGEPTIQYQVIEKLATFIKSRELIVGIQTNGYFPERIKRLVENRLIDKIFLDVKAYPLDNSIYKEITHVKDASDKIIETLNLPLKYDIPIEIRTTIFRSINFAKEISQYLLDNNLNYEFVIQQGIPWNTLDNKLRKEDILTRNEIINIVKNLKNEKIKIKTKEKGEEYINYQ